MKRVFVALLCLVNFAGCATLQASDTRSAEYALAAAGFHVRPADTPEKLAQLAGLTPRTLMRRPLDGEVQYIYADLTICQCLYVGSEAEYQRLRQQEQAAVDRFFAVDESGSWLDWRAWGISIR
jgi:hypothetical protein